MNLSGLADDLYLIFRDYRASALKFISLPDVPAFRILLERHLPLLLLLPMASLLTPSRSIFNTTISLKYHIVSPLIIITLFLFLAIIYDRIIEHATPPGIFNSDKPHTKNLSLFFHLPLPSAGIFFFIHVKIGYLMLFVAIIYSVALSIRVQYLLRPITAARAIMYYISSIVFLLIPTILLLLILNFLRTYRIIQGLI